MTETLGRECAVCGTDLTIHVADDGTYEGGHYWPELLDDREYWECEDCYRGEGKGLAEETGRSPDEFRSDTE